MALENSLRRGRPLEALEGWFRWANAHGENENGGGDSSSSSSSTARLLRLVSSCAVSHYNDLTAVAAAMAALDACSLPTWPLRVDVAALRRIALYRASQVPGPPFGPSITHANFGSVHFLVNHCIPVQL
jgi:hypothetical protein